MAFALRRAARIGIRVILGVLLSGATMAGIGAAGVAQTMGTSFGGTAPSAPPEGWPAAAVAPPGRIAVAVVLGATGSVVTDALAPIEVFARSSAFFVYTVSVHRQPVPLSGGLHVLPDHALADVDAGTAPRPGVVVVPAVIDPTGPAQAPLRAWITRQANRGARILGVCAGSVLLAETGLLDGLQATSFWQRISGLRRAHPAVRWRSGVRYVEDGPVTTTAGVTSGVVGALRLVEKLAGTQEAERIGTDIGYPGWSLDGSIVATTGPPGAVRPGTTPRATTGPPGAIRTGTTPRGRRPARLAQAEKEPPPWRRPARPAQSEKAHARGPPPGRERQPARPAAVRKGTTTRTAARRNVGPRGSAPRPAYETPPVRAFGGQGAPRSWRWRESNPRPPAV